MINIFTTEQSREIDSLTITREPIAPIDLVERAAHAFAAEFTARYEDASRIVVFAGQGNNGADALAVARILSDAHNLNVETCLINPTGKLSPECETNRERLLQSPRQTLTEMAGNKFYPPVLGKNDIVIDGLFGSGLNRPLEGGFAAVVKYINASQATVVSIDIPSGLFGEDNSANDPEAIIRSDLTLTFGFPSIVFMLPESAPYIKKWKAIDIGLHPGAVSSVHANLRIVEEEDAARLLRPRSRFAHKGTFGHALMIAGSRGKLGAALLASQSCLRSGAGLITVHIPACGEIILQTSFPEAMLSIDNSALRFTSPPADLPTFSAIAVGPGLGLHPDTSLALEILLSSVDRPIVLDADALNIISSRSNLLDMIPSRSILTPHPKEFDRLAGSDSANGYERLQKAIRFAATHSVILILKGACTAVCLPDGEVRFNSSGNAGMATAGSGDVLTGVILGLICAGYEPEDAATLGVFIHGMAGDLAVASLSEEAMIASDITGRLGKAFKHLRM
ncbi:MAG: NAD(P)H-hydrate dehydratase [Tannerellaceae bacterium]|jgi:NAD(P)H-hydrate epimerase|nr:NAD(P)H-hydrate dehydratase [Tannerellaceae bacterium]